MKWWRLIGEYNAETTTFSACAGNVTSPYTPDKSGRLTGLRVIPNGGVATSLINHVEFRLSCTSFEPNVLEVGGQGNGLQTVPATPQGVYDFDIDQPVEAGVPITVEARNLTDDTPVTVMVELYARFES